MKKKTFDSHKIVNDVTLKKININSCSLLIKFNLITCKLKECS